MVHNDSRVRANGRLRRGFTILRLANAGTLAREASAETRPFDEAEFYKYELNLPKIAELWRRRSVISSWLLDLTAIALRQSPALGEYSGMVYDSGKGGWTIDAAIDEAVPTPVLSAALFAPFSSRGEANLADRLLSALHAQYGGHAERPAEGQEAHDDR